MRRFFDYSSGALIGMGLTMWAGELGRFHGGVSVNGEAILIGLACLACAFFLAAIRAWFLTLI